MKQFVPLTEYDMYMFSEGENPEIYKKMGAHYCKKGNIKGTYFSLWAPNAKSVSVVGDFNQHKRESGKMEKNEKFGIWQIFLKEASPDDSYVYSIETENEIIEKSDPYANYSELSPKTSSIIYNHNFSWNDDDYIRKREKIDFNESPIAIYELHAGSWKKKTDGSFYTYRELADELIDYVIDLGFTHIELMPIMEHPFYGSWGYQVTGYFSPTSRYGKPEDLKYFIDCCHQKGIGVLLDWVPAHFPRDSHGLANFDGTPLYECADSEKKYHEEWNTFFFDYSKKQVQNFLISNVFYWFEYFHADGIRVDAVATLLGIDYYTGSDNSNCKIKCDGEKFIENLNAQISSRYKGVMIIAEDSSAVPGITKPVDKNGKGFSFKWNMGWMNDFLNYLSYDPICRKNIHNKLTFSMTYAFNENYILPLSHDEVVHCKKSLISKMPGDPDNKFAGLKSAIAHMYCHPGKKLLFMGAEIGQWSEWNHDSQLDWELLKNEKNLQLQDYIRDLNSLYKSHPAMYQIDNGWAGFEWINCDDAEKSVISYIRKGRKLEDMVIAIINFTPVERKNYRIGVPLNCEYEVILNSDFQKYGGKTKNTNEIILSENRCFSKKNYSICVKISPNGTVLIAPKI